MVRPLWTLGELRKPLDLGLAALNATLRALDYHVQDVHAKWLMYRQLFGRTEERYDVLMQAAGAIFTKVDQAMLEDAQLALYRLGDPATSSIKGGRVPNLTLRRLQDELGVRPAELRSRMHQNRPLKLLHQRANQQSMPGLPRQ